MAPVGQSISHPTAPNSWSRQTVQVITHVKTWAIRKITSLAMPFIAWAVQLWFRWKGVPNPIDSVQLQELAKISSTPFQQLKNVTLKEDMKKFQEEIQIPPETPKTGPTETITPTEPRQIKEIPLFARGNFTAHLKESPENSCLTVEQITIPSAETFKNKFEFCRDLIIHAHNLNEDLGYKRNLRIETTTTEINHLFRYCGCLSFNGSEKLGIEEKLAMAEVFKSSLFLVPCPTGENLILTVPSQILIIQAAKAKQKILTATQANKNTKQMFTELRNLYDTIYERAKEAYFQTDHAISPKDPLNPIIIIKVNGKLQRLQFSYEIALDQAFIALKSVTIEDLNEMDITSQMLCSAHALWAFMTIPEKSERKISVKAERKIFAHSLQDAKMYSLLGFVPHSHIETLVSLYQKCLKARKTACRSVEQEVEKKLPSFSENFPEEQRALVNAILQEVKTTAAFRRRFKEKSENRDILFYQIYSLLVKSIAEAYFNQTKTTQIAFKTALKELVNSLDFTNPQEFVTLTEKDKDLWISNGPSMPIELEEQVLFLIQENSLYEKEFKKK